MKAKLYNTRTSEKVEVTLAFSTQALSVSTPGRTETYPVSSIRFSDRLADMPRTIYLPDGCVCETKENDGIDAFLARLKRDRASRLLHYLESKMRYVAAALVTTTVFTYGFIAYGLPNISEHVAEKIPAPVVYSIGSGTLDTLDRVLLEPTKLPRTRQEELREYFGLYIQNEQEWPKIKLEFRSGKLGPNALALPDGTIVFTDDLVNLAKDNKELLSIFFHELGHVQRRHALRTVLQDSAFYLIVSAITGDATSASSLLATLPTMLVESNYSRKMETEADDYAYELMKKHHIPHKHFANIMERLLKTMPKSDDAMKYLSTHPQTHSRIAKFRHTE